MEHLNITLKGKVQHIGLRYQIKEYADAISVFGYVRNTSDGNIYIESEGDKVNLYHFIEWLELSPGLSEIKSIETNKGEDKHYREFQIY